ncbi:hypothetical protein KDAU_70920 [Dictyobacter aurantiacus]|uniref:Uncharacterized protein n=1 Tax=Dictyobacter aurantiacus TaxID=1936993 RepID=A0A401ZSC9_9CHLR|nr:hypothetical protein KDAU_70920 [Dictyobacter aurantiacus]
MNTSQHDGSQTLLKINEVYGNIYMYTSYQGSRLMVGFTVEGKLVVLQFAYGLWGGVNILFS